MEEQRYVSLWIDDVPETTYNYFLNVSYATCRALLWGSDYISASSGPLHDGHGTTYCRLSHGSRYTLENPRAFVTQMLSTNIVAQRYCIKGNLIYIFDRSSCSSYTGNWNSPSSNLPGFTVIEYFLYQKNGDTPCYLVYW